MLLYWPSYKLPEGKRFCSYIHRSCNSIVCSVNYRDIIAPSRHIYLCSIRADCNSHRANSYRHVSCDSVVCSVNYRDSIIPIFVTYTFVPSGLTATPKGPIPTCTLAVTVFVVVSITEIVLCCLSHIPLFHWS